MGLFYRQQCRSAPGKSDRLLDRRPLALARQQIQLRLVNCRCRSCHSDGWLTSTTCTAVTLYSGQLVAQSELSVVMTLAPDSGKWKVV